MSPSRISLCLILCTLLVIVCAALASASNYGDLSAEWSKTYNTNESLHSPLMTPVYFNVSADGSYFITGYFDDLYYGAGGTAFVIKADRNGSILWNETLPAAGPAKGVYVKATDDGGCIVARAVTKDLGVGACDIIKLDSRGTREWIASVPAENSETSKLIDIGGIVFSDGGYVVALNNLRNYRGIDYLTPEGEDAGVWIPAMFNDIIMVKIDARGNVVWKNVITGKFDQSAKDIVKAPAGGYLVVGSTTSYASDSGDLDRDFEATYELNFQGKRVLLYRPPGAISSTSMSYIMQQDVFLVRVGEDGTVAWKKTYGGDGPDYGVTALPAGNDYLILGYGYSGRMSPAANGSNGADRKPLVDLYLLKVDSAGNPLWEKDYAINNSSLNMYTAMGIFASGQNYVLIGENPSRKSFADDSEFYLLTVDGSGSLVSQKAYAADEELIHIERLPSGEYAVLTNTYDVELTKLGSGSSAGTGSGSNSDASKKTDAVTGIATVVLFIATGLMLAAGRRK
jgi:hypothetical protein